MKKLKNLVVGGMFSLFMQPSMSQCNGNPVLIKIDADRKNENIEYKIDMEYSFYGENPSNGELRNTCKNKVLNIYYENDEFKLDKNDSIDLKKYEEIFKENPDYFQIVGYADINGKTDYNYKLALNRAEKVSSFIKKKYPKCLVELVSAGESGSEDNLDESRKVTIIPNTPSFYSAFNNIKSDYVLLDLSGSMNWYIPRLGFTKYDVLSAVKFPKDSEIFAFFSGSVNSGSEIPHIKELKPKGCSEIYGSAKDLLDKVIEDGKTLTIFTDGISTDKYNNYIDVIESANKKNIKVSIIGVEIPKNRVEEYRKITTNTGGEYSFGDYLTK
jgi:outer membrane protein OmpA-like peptidoglycan-associated protein